MPSQASILSHPLLGTSELRQDGDSESAGPLAAWTVEQDPDFRSPYGPSKDTRLRAFYSAVVTLSLGVLGSTVLPVPFAISKTGIAVGVITMTVVAYANDLTSCMLIEAAAATGALYYAAQVIGNCFWAETP